MSSLVFFCLSFCSLSLLDLIRLQECKERIDYMCNLMWTNRLIWMIHTWLQYVEWVHEVYGIPFDAFHIALWWEDFCESNSWIRFFNAMLGLRSTWSVLLDIFPYKKWHIYVVVTFKLQISSLEPLQWS